MSKQATLTFKFWCRPAVNSLFNTRIIQICFLNIQIMFRINRFEEKDRSYLNSCKFQEIFTWIEFIILFNHCNMVEMNILILQIKKISEIREIQNLDQGHTASRQRNEKETTVCVTRILISTPAPLPPYLRRDVMILIH